ncbi:MAG: alpha-ketoacid dehydrogenase subunit beta [Solirubrobacteraceae bacterium]
MLEFRTAINQALAEELERDDRVFLLGEDIGAAGGVFKVTDGLLERFGAERVIDTPISEMAIAGAAFGSAITGRRPVVEIMFGDFMAIAMDSLVNQSAKWWFVSNEQTSVPVTVRCAVGAGGRFGAIHSQSPGTWLDGVPGLKIAAPSTPASAKALLKAAIRDDDPVVFLEHKRLYSTKGAEDEHAPGRLGAARVVRAGGDVTLVSLMKGVGDCVAASELLAAEGIAAEVVDLQSLRPLDVATVVASLERTNRLVCIEEGPRTGGWAAGLVGAIAVDALDLLDDVDILATPDHPVPFAAALEDAFLPSPETIASTVRARLGVAAA